MVKLKYFLIVNFFLWGLKLSAQEKESSIDLVTDRPDETEAPSLLPSGYLQIETGFYFSASGEGSFEQKEIGYNTTLLRYGLLDNLELRVGTDVLKTKLMLNGQEIRTTETGFAPLLIGGKVGIAQENGLLPEIGILGHLYLPFAASKQYRAATTGVDFRLAFSHTLTEDSDLSYNIGSEWLEDTPFATYIYTLAYGYGITGSFGAYAELYGNLPENDQAEHFFDAGLTYLIKDNLQLDLFAGTGLNHSHKALIGGGFSYRIPK